CGCTRWWNCGRGTAADPNWSTAATRPGTPPPGALRTPTVAKPYANRFSAANYRTSPPPGRYHEKSSNWPKISWPWPLNVILSSESADLASPSFKKGLGLEGPRYSRQTAAVGAVAERVLACVGKD